MENQEQTDIDIDIPQEIQKKIKEYYQLLAGYYQNLNNNQKINLSEKDIQITDISMLKFCNEGLQGKQRRAREAKFFISFKDYIKDYINKDLEKIQQVQSEESLTQLISEQFNNFIKFLHKFCKIFSSTPSVDFFTNQFDKREGVNANQQNLSTYGFIVFRETYWEGLQNKIFKQISQILQKIRQGFIVETNMFTIIINIFRIIGSTQDIVLTNNEFLQMVSGEQYIKSGQEKPYIFTSKSSSQAFYEEKFEKNLISLINEYTINENQNLEQLSTYDKIMEFGKILEKEGAIADKYYPYSKERVFDKLSEQLLIKDAQSLLQRQDQGIYHIVKNSDQRLKLKQIYNVLNLHDKLKQDIFKFISQELEKYFKFRCNKLNSDLQDLKEQKKGNKDLSIKFCTDLDEILQLLDLIFDVYFKSQQIQYKNQIYNIIQFNINAIDKCCFYFSIFTDNQFKTINNEQEQSFLKLAYEQFQLFISKDEVVKHYSNLLMKRILGETMKNSELERNIITKFNSASDMNTVKVLDEMLKDKEMSKTFIQDHSEQFKKISNGIEFKLLSVTKTSWPLKYDQKDQILPQVCQPLFDLYQKIYQKKYVSRIVSIIPIHGTAQVTFKTDKKYILDVSCLQMFTLLFLEENNNNTIEQIMENLKVDYNHIVNDLQALVDKKICTCQKKENSDIIEKLIVNTNFKYKSTKINTKPSSKKIGDKDQNEQMKNDLKALELQREYIAQATMVRIMKSKRQENQRQLFTEVVEQIKIFKVEPKILKKSMEHLISNDYFERGQDDINLIIYKP